MKPLRPSPLSRTLALLPPAVVLVAQHANAGFNTFIKIGSMVGESVDTKHSGWIELQSVQWGVARPISMTPGSGNRVVGTPSITELTIAKLVDRSSPELFLNAVAGQSIDTVTLELMNSAATSAFYRLTLSNVLVSNQSFSAATGADKPSESVSLNFTKIKIEYYYQDAKGALTAVPAVGWDLSKSQTF